MSSPRAAACSSVLWFGWLCCSGGALAAQNDAAPANEPVFEHEFGAPGSRGGFRVRFNDHGAAIVWLQTMDHFVDAHAARKTAHTPADYLLLTLARGGHLLRLQQRANSTLIAPDLASVRWTRELPGDGSVRFSLDAGNGLVFGKTYRHRPDQRGLELELQLRRAADANIDGELQLELFGAGLVSGSDASLFGNPCLAIAQAVGGDPHWLGSKAGVQQQLLQLDGQPWSMAGNTNRFFGAFLFPRDETAARVVQSVEVVTGPPTDDPDSHTAANTVPRVLLALRLPVPAAAAATTATFGLYLGPKSFHVFGESPEHERFLPIMDVDLDPPCCGITVPGGRFMAKMLVKLLGFFDGLVGSWGIAIMMLTILVRGCLAPVNFRMQKSMRAYGARMGKLKPQLDRIKQQYADDPRAYQQAMLAFQREHKLMPPLAGCLPIFLTMPIYIGLFTALRTAYDLRQQSFLFMPDLSRPDSLFALGFWPHNFNIMPILWIGMFVWFSLRMPLPADPQQRQVQQMMRFMPILFGVMLYNYASGLMVYMVTSMLWTFGESAITKKILGPIDPSAAGMTPSPMM